MAITDLTGYTWYGNETISLTSDITYNIIFLSNGEEYNRFYIEAPFNPFSLRYINVTTNILNVRAYEYSSQSWKSESYRTIQITGGTDATNPDLIAWLEANGTLSPPIPTEDPDYLIKESTLTNIADAIRSKTGDSDELNPVDMPEAIESIETGITPTGNIQLTQQSGTNVTNYATASVRGASVALNTPTVNSSGLVTASASVSTTGWIGSAPANKTLQLTTQAGKTVTPSASSQTAVASGRYTTGAVTVAAVPSETKTVALSMASGDQSIARTSGKWMTSVTVQKPATLIASNIKKDVNIGGVVGTMEAGEDLTALNTEINELDGTTGTKSVAQMTTAVSNANDEVDDQSALIEQIQTALQSKSGGGGGGAPIIIDGERVDSLTLRFVGSEDYDNYIVTLIGNADYLGRFFPAGRTVPLSFQSSGNSFLYHDFDTQYTTKTLTTVFVKTGSTIIFNPTVIGSDVEGHFVDSSRAIYRGIFW